MRVNHKVTDQIEPGYEWILDPDVLAVDKLHGTNVGIRVHEGTVVAISNRENQIWKKEDGLFKKAGILQQALYGILSSQDRGWMPKQDGVYYGELIGPKINGNIHGADSPLWVPFDYLREKCHWHSWVKGQHPKTFESISEWFKELPSLFSKIVFNKTCIAEGLIFCKPPKTGKFGRMAKLRRDMFDWYVGDHHGRKLD